MPILAEGGTTALDTAITAIKTALADLSTANLTSVIVAGLAIAVPLVLVWFGFRFVYKKAKGALKKGV